MCSVWKDVGINSMLYILCGNLCPKQCSSVHGIAAQAANVFVCPRYSKATTVPSNYRTLSIGACGPLQLLGRHVELRGRSREILKGQDCSSVEKVEGN